MVIMYFCLHKYMKLLISTFGYLYMILTLPFNVEITSFDCITNAANDGALLV